MLAARWEALQQRAISTCLTHFDDCEQRMLETLVMKTWLEQRTLELQSGEVCWQPMRPAFGLCIFEPRAQALPSRSSTGPSFRDLWTLPGPLLRRDA